MDEESVKAKAGLYYEGNYSETEAEIKIIKRKLI